MGFEATYLYWLSLGFFSKRPDRWVFFGGLQNMINQYTIQTRYLANVGVHFSHVGNLISAEPWTVFLVSQWVNKHPYCCWKKKSVLCHKGEKLSPWCHCLSQTSEDPQCFTWQVVSATAFTALQVQRGREKWRAVGVRDLHKDTQLVIFSGH